MRMNEDPINPIEIKEDRVHQPMDISLPQEDEDEFMIINENDCTVGVGPTRFDLSINPIEIKDVWVERMDEDKEPIESMKRCKRACEDRFAMAIRKPKVEIKVRAPGYSPPRKRIRLESCTLPLVSPPVVVHARDQMKIRAEKCILLGRTRLVFPKVLEIEIRRLRGDGNYIVL